MAKLEKPKRRKQNKIEVMATLDVCVCVKWRSKKIGQENWSTLNRSEPDEWQQKRNLDDPGERK